LARPSRPNPARPGLDGARSVQLAGVFSRMANGSTGTALAPLIGD
jgi:hypothetical protein